ncbi:MAG: hypothetical protein VX438_08970, partial [Planctomycetota bacterium]|nr:hypothetical protein [Planctomycetota bacterium]
ETAAIAALTEHFEVISVTFEDEKTMESRKGDKPGWRITPYAYILLKARGQEVDVIPPVKLDLDFLDTSGYAVLPIESKAIPVDTQTNPPDPRPIQQLQITQTLDERRSGEGKLVLEVKATARGLIPEFDEILDIQAKGFEVIEEQDQGVSVSAFDSESNTIQLITEREWLLELKAKDDAGRPTSFEFCSAQQSSTPMKYKRYDDADLVDVESRVALDNQYGQTKTGWLIWLGIAAVATFFGILTARSRFRRPALAPAFKYHRPSKITPLSVISLLKEIKNDENLEPDQAKQLESVIHEIEKHFFSSQSAEAPDLDKETDRWLSLAN